MFIAIAVKSAPQETFQKFYIDVRLTNSYETWIFRADVVPWGSVSAAADPNVPHAESAANPSHDGDANGGPTARHDANGAARNGTDAGANADEATRNGASSSSSSVFSTEGRRAVRCRPGTGCRSADAVPGAASRCAACCSIEGEVRVGPEE